MPSVSLVGPLRSRVPGRAMLVATSVYCLATQPVPTLR